MFKNILTYHVGKKEFFVVTKDIPTLSEYISLLLDENIPFKLIIKES